MKVIQCYAPTNDSDEETKDRFYSRLQSILDKCRENDVIIIMGYFNTKIRPDNNGYEEVMGTQGVGEMNENGERFADTFALNNVTIGGSMSTHKRMHKTTWVSPDHLTENHIDHICIGKRNLAHESAAEGKETSNKQQSNTSDKGTGTGRSHKGANREWRKKRMRRLKKKRRKMRASEAPCFYDQSGKILDSSVQARKIGQKVRGV
ncbi:hypothetical protein LSH36_4g05004 [Paralvinella palmiformis]|uniref:60S ribosomal protein L41 n=1 Tax=Paralvinella palmiformis TaxID=53620 RepID=A0AAD9KE96_9ANNE|nr:hypothetical protein LSH36_4g05004 [Paralvinella palmiformis]